MDPASNPCGQHFQGYKQCNGKQFVTFYAGEAGVLVSLVLAAGSWCNWQVWQQPRALCC
jgi:hypothetical protein